MPLVCRATATPVTPTNAVREKQMPPRSRAPAGKGKGASPPAPKLAMFQPLPPHSVGRWRCDEAASETVEQLLYGPIHTRRPTLVCASLESAAEAALGAEAEAQLFGGGAEMAAAYKAVAYGERGGWEACPPDVSSRLAAGLPRWLVPRIAGDLLCRIPATAAAQHVKSSPQPTVALATCGSRRSPTRTRRPTWLQRIATAAWSPQCSPGS